MIKPAHIALVLALVAIAFAGGATWSHRRSAPAGPGAAAILHYACPMHPQYKSDRPGDCPSCGMRLEPVRADGSGTTGAGGGGLQIPAGAIQVSPDRQQTIGVRLGKVERVSGTRPLRTTGRVAPNENATYPLVSGVQARVREVRSATAGTLVKKNEVLASLYAPEYLTTAQGFLYALNNLERVGTQDPNQASTAAANVQRSADTLRNLGVSEGQIEDMRKTRALTPHITIASPVDGFILQRNVLVGQRVEAGSELYRVADLRRVWIFADVYESEQRFIRPGTRARVTASQLSGQSTAVVSSAQPLFDEVTRTLRVRLETNNPGTALLPGMFVDVEFSVDVPPALAVPADAIVDSGLRKTVFVDRGSGYFEPRAVETGWRIGGQVEVLKGLMEGERIVISGTFLIDSESRMKAAAQGVHGAAAKDPVCGMDVDQKKAAAAGRSAVHAGHTYYFCADDCKKKFEAEPGRWVGGKL
jgi:RND family efflux transporter MFP subunit